MNVIVADRSPLMRSVLVRVFEDAADIEVVGSIGGLSELLASCRQRAPEVVLAGISFGDGDLMDGIATMLLEGARVLVICDVAASELASMLLFAGASGCLFVQDVCAADVVAATRDVADGNAALHPAAAAAVLRQWRAARQPAPPVASDSANAAPQLTPREAEVLDALARGLPTKTIGRELAVSPKTVEAHIARLLAKLDARNRAQAVSVALDRGLLDSHPVAELAGGS